MIICLKNRVVQSSTQKSSLGKSLDIDGLPPNFLVPKASRGTIEFQEHGS